MNTNSTPAEKLATANKSVRNWVIAFVVFAAINVAAITSGHNNLLLQAAMVFTVVMSLLAIHKREQTLLVPIPVAGE